MKDSDKKILIVILGIAILALAIMYVYKPAKEDIDSLNAEIAGLQAKYDDLKAKEAQRETLIAETEAFNQLFDEELKNYPADLNQETTVMFMKGIEEQYDFVNTSISLPRDTQFYVLGEGSGEGDIVVSEDESAPAEEKYVCTTAGYGIVYEGTYAGLKDYLDYIANYKYKINVSTLNISYDQINDMCNGTLTLNMYAVNGPDRTPETVDVDVPNGVENIFVGGNKSLATTDKYASDNGAAITTSHNLIMLLNNANSDTSGIIIAADENSESTYVTSSDNSAVEVKVNVYSTDGKNFVSYEIGDKTYEKEVLTNDVTIYVKSSARVDGDDSNAAQITVSNTTALPVYFKVEGDDSVSPRFKVVNKSGVVKVY